MSDDHKTVGNRRRRGTDNDDVHATGKAVRGNDDVHATGKAVRGNDDVHATGRAVRGDADNLRPFEQRNGGKRPGVSADAKASVKAEWPSEFELEGKKYKNEGILSASSGEAVVFTVTRSSKKYALKIYYYNPDHRPNHSILERIKQLGDSGLLVKIVSHGVWRNPDSDHEENDYELMEFCEGGSLDGVVLAGDEKALTEVAVRMGAAIDFLSKHGILHRDIKPGNFFYADKAKTQIVLADFGISAECPVGETCRIDEMRSPVYASPEFYTNVPGEPAEVGVESDFFSLGVSLLCLWIGKTKLTANESQLLRSKLNETLPIPKDMSAHLSSLIKALTRLKMSDRATFEDIKRWCKGEDLDTSGVQSDFHVVFNSSKNQIATSPAQLAQFLIEDKPLGKKYLYSGRVTRWLEETGHNESAVNVEEIVEDIYPSNQNAGLMAVAYLLDPSLDYVAPDGSHHTDPTEISKLILYHNREMCDEVLASDSNLMIYLRALKMDKTVASVQDYVNSKQYHITDDEAFNSVLACLYLALLLDPQMPLSLLTDDGMTEVDTVEQLIGILHDLGEPGAINMSIIGSPAFLVWLAARNPALAGKIRMLYDKSNDDKESIYYHSNWAYRIVYELDPAMDYWFGTDPKDSNRVYSVEQVGRMLNDRLNQMQQGGSTPQDFFNLFCYMDSDRVGHYLRARGENYLNFLNWNRYCMDTDDEENKQKAGDYDVVIGAYKSVAGFLGHAPYFTIGDCKITSLEELRQLPKSSLAPLLGGKVREMNKEGGVAAWLDAWVALFFQENPKLDLSTKFTYEKETAKYVEFIGEIAPKNYFVERYRRAIKEIDEAATDLKRSHSNIKGKRIFFLALGLIPTLVTLIGSWFCDFPESNPISGHFMVTSLICFAGIFVFSWAAMGFGSGFMSGLIGGLVAAAIIYTGFAWFPSILYMAGGIVLLISACYFVVQLMKRQKVDTGGVTIRGDEFEYRQLDALYFAYHQDTDTLDNVVKKYSEIQQDYDDVTREDLNTVGWMWASIAWTISAIWFFATPQISGENTWAKDLTEIKLKADKWVLGEWTVKYASGSTRIVCNIDSVTESKRILGTMIIAGQAPVKAEGVVYSTDDTIPSSFTFKPIDVAANTKTVDVEYDKSTKSFRGYYYDRKGIMHEVVITPPMVSDVKATESKGTSSYKDKAKSKKSGQVVVDEAESHESEEVGLQERNQEQNEIESHGQESDNLLENETSPASGLWEDTM
ncbi:MAG: protein kinase [Prevotellaceae bacterium]|nr:protein kinase [Prevotellaceae bacterium]